MTWHRSRRMCFDHARYVSKVIRRNSTHAGFLCQLHERFNRQGILGMSNWPSFEPIGYDSPHSRQKITVPTFFFLQLVNKMLFWMHLALIFENWNHIENQCCIYRIFKPGCRFDQITRSRWPWLLYFFWLSLKKLNFDFVSLSFILVISVFCVIMRHQ